MAERVYQAKVIKKIRERYPGAIVLKNDPNYLQGMLDWTILHNNWWGVLEIKDSENSPYQPNQKYYIDLLDRMSFARAIYPENEDEVLYELQRSLRSHR